MDEPLKQQSNDGDDYGNSVKQISNVAKHAGKVMENKAAVTSSAVAEKAVAGAAAKLIGGIISGVWSMRHTLFKILATICFTVVIIIVIVVSLPQIIFDSIFASDDSQQTVNPMEVYNELAEGVASMVHHGYDLALEKVKSIIVEGDFDRDKSFAAVIDDAKKSKDYDVCYILAAYSVSMQQKSVTQKDMLAKIKKVGARIFPVTYEVVEEQKEEDTSTVKYAVCTIHCFDSKAILSSFGVELTEEYGDFGITNIEAIAYMTEILKTTLFGKEGRWKYG